jgi:hypothetical protein
MWRNPVKYRQNSRCGMDCQILNILTELAYEWELYVSRKFSKINTALCTKIYVSLIENDDR